MRFRAWRFSIICSVWV